MRESLKIMSMQRNAYALSYISIQSLFILFTTIVLWAGFMFGYTNPQGSGGSPFILLFGVLFFGLGMLAEAMCLSTFFNDSKLST
jgi:ABC-type transport system involved in multi-copper enzyme maturation permease subunit